MRRLFFSLVLCLVCASALHAQAIDPYRRLVDPLAIARLDDADFFPLRGVYGMGFGFGQDPNEPDHYIYAQDSGSGILTHFFVTARTPDSLTNYKLWIDGKLYRSASLHDFYSSDAGVMRGPLDTMMGEARICETQIPYHTGFKLTYKTNDYRTFFNYIWRPLPASLVAGLNGITSSTLLAEQAAAEERYHNPRLLWQGFGGVDSVYQIDLRRDSDTTALTLSGSNVVRRFWLKPDWYGEGLDSVWCDIYWDGEAQPSFSTPLLALFGQSYDFRDLHSLPIDFTQGTGFDMQLPMPFQHSMRIAFRNRASKPVHLDGFVTFFPYSVDRSQLGYLHTHFNQINPTQYHVPHHVLHVKGKGRYIGLLMGIPHLRAGSTYEGDPMFVADSSDRFSFHYDGMEDYFDGAQYFSYGEFFSPFGGTSNLYANYFRFHYLDAFPFNTSFDFDFGHDIDNDAHEHYRTLAFWYQYHPRFWTDRDTIRVGEPWHLAGTGYLPGESIQVSLDSTPITTLKAADGGGFDAVVQLPHLAQGFYKLRLNGEAWPETILVTYQPTLRLLKEPLPITLQTGDTLPVEAIGFGNNDSLTAYLGTTALPFHKASVATGRTEGYVIIPKLPDGAYAVSLEGSTHALARSPEQVHLTRVLQYEGEDIVDSTSAAPHHSRFFSVGWLYSLDWSHNAVALFSPTVDSPDLTLHFSVPVADSFEVVSYQAIGGSFGDFDLYLDGTYQGHSTGYDAKNFRPDSTTFGFHYLTEGSHSLRYRYTGRQSGTADSMLWVDRIVLRPITPLANGSGGSSVSQPNRPLGWEIAEDPVIDQELRIRLSSSDQSDSDEHRMLVVTDVTGRTVLRQAVDVYRSTELSIPVARLSAGIYFAKLNGSTRVFHVLH